MSWDDQLGPQERAEWDRFVKSTREDAMVKIMESAFVMSLVPRGEPDIKFCVELGLAIMLDKPIVAVVMPGAEVPERLRLVADEIIEADLDLAEGRELIASRLRELVERS
jgi:hypothetical protein